jgi:hypothetical protein
MLFVQAFAIATNWATIDVATNWITGAPYVEFSQDLGNPQWLAAPSQIVTSNSTYWRIQCPATASQRFYRAVSPGGANEINSYYKHNFPAGLTVEGQTFTSAVVQAATPAAIGAVPTNDTRYLAAITNAVIVPITTYTTTNPVITLSEGRNAWNWTPPTNAPCSPTFAGPGAGWAGSGMLRIIQTNNSVAWPATVVWFVNGTNSPVAPTLGAINRIVVDYFDNIWSLHLIPTNAAVAP